MVSLSYLPPPLRRSILTSLSNGLMRQAFNQSSLMAVSHIPKLQVFIIITFFHLASWTQLVLKETKLALKLVDVPKISEPMLFQTTLTLREKLSSELPRMVTWSFDRTRTMEHCSHVQHTINVAASPQTTDHMFTLSATGILTPWTVSVLLYQKLTLPAAPLILVVKLTSLHLYPLLTL